jgi:hypothetical protein
MKDAQGGRRLDDPDDVMRVEIEAVLKHDVPVIPVLIDDAKTPKRPKKRAGQAADSGSWVPRLRSAGSSSLSAGSPSPMYHAVAHRL